MDNKTPVTTSKLRQIFTSEPDLPKEIQYNPQFEKFNEDYNYSRDRLKALVDMGEEAIEACKDVAFETSEPRAFEVLATLIKNTGDLAKSVMENAKTKSDIDAQHSKKITNPEKPTQNIFFTGSGKDILDHVREQNPIDVIPEEIEEEEHLPVEKE